MNFSNRRFEFKIPDEWWSAADMIGFVPRRQAYRASPHPDAGMIVLPIDWIGVRRRNPGIPDFSRERMIKVLKSIRLGDAMLPIEVQVEVEGVDGLSHRLYDGRHRLAASIAVGYSHVPAVVVRDLDAIKRAEGMA
jgi:hypothetical protein